MITEQRINGAYVRYFRTKSATEFIQTARIKNGVLHVTNYPSWLQHAAATGKPVAKFRIKFIHPKN